MKQNQIKTEEEIKIMKRSGQICAKALKKVLNNVKPGVTCLSLDAIAREEIEKRGATSSFMTVEGYKYTICTTINEQVVHGIPTGRKLKEGDILSIDIGALYNGYHSDLAITVPVGKVSKDTQAFIDTGMQTLKAALKQVKVGNYIGDISESIQKGIENSGYSIVKSLTGHGVGTTLHEDPMVPGHGKKETGPQIKKNMTLAVEVIYTNGSGEVGVEKDNWTITASDGTLGGLFEQTVAVKRSGPIVLTPYL